MTILAMKKSFVALLAHAALAVSLIPCALQGSIAHAQDYPAKPIIMVVPYTGAEPAVIARLREAAKTAANDPRVRQTIGGSGSPIQYLDAPEFQKYWDVDAAKMAGVVKIIRRMN
jgi:tripartite-type tricarboxylate transporter receptor subunit TctC